MATVNFLFRSTKQKAPLTLRLLYRHNNKDYVFSVKTKFDVERDYWKKHYKNTKDAEIKKMQVKVNSELQKIESHVLDAFNEENVNLINKEWLIEQIDLFYNPLSIEKESEDALYWIAKIALDAHLKDNGKGGVGLSKSRINAYNRLSELFKEFQRNKKVKIKELDRRKFEDFKKWLFSKEYSETYALKKLSDLKTVCKEAKANGIETASDYFGIKTKQGKTYEEDMDVITLTNAEIASIEEVELKNQALINARKWLILACFTGQRGQALIERIKEENFHIYGKDLIIKFRQKKGNKPVTIPVLPKVKQIYEEGLPYPISIQKLNKHFKTIGRLAKINQQIMGRKQEVIEIETKHGKKKVRRGVKKLRPKFKYFSSHIGRRTFATIHNNILPRPVIMKVTGHTKESTFLSYINQSNDEHLDIFFDYYKTKELKEQKTSELNIVKEAQ
ncbi:site-specific integrase [Flavobacteriaceae bacterium S0862]|nr:site-specific integrase [Flavobacteriaceae bacterium S0862]